MSGALSLQHYKSVVEHLPIGVLIWHLEDPEDSGSLRLEAVNPAASKATGTDMDALVGTTMRESFSSFLETSLPDAYIYVLRTGQTRKLGHVEYGDDRVSRGTYELTAAPLGDDRVVVYFENVTQIVAAERARRHAERRAEANAARLARTNQALQQFTVVASHDLQEPLRKISAFSDALAEDHSDALGSEAQGLVEKINDASDRMGRLIQDLLVLSRVANDIQTPTRVELARICREALIDLDVRVSETSMSLEFGELPAVMGEPRLLQQLFQNLISNAIKFRRRGVRSVVRIASVPKDPGSSSLGEGLVRVVVEDNGIGFDQKDAARIFAPFERLHGRGAYPGTGMGLALVYKIVASHNGAITVRSKPGVGTSFTIDLPGA